MASDVDKLQAQLATLKTCRASGVLRAQHDGVMVEYRVMADLERAIAAIERELAIAKRECVPRSFMLSHDKDL